MTLQGCASSDHRWPITKLVLLDDITGSTMFTTASSDSFILVTCAQCEPALICEENRAEMADLPFLWPPVWMCHPGRAGRPGQPDWAAATASCYQEWQGHYQNTKLEKNQSGRIMREQLYEATTCKTIPFSGVVLVLPLSCTWCHFHLYQVETDSQPLVLPKWKNVYPWSLTDLLLNWDHKCSLNFLEGCSSNL